MTYELWIMMSFAHNFLSYSLLISHRVHGVHGELKDIKVTERPKGLRSTQRFANELYTTINIANKSNHNYDVLMRTLFE